MSRFAIIAIGASAGSFEPVRELVSRFPKDIPAAIFIVMHVGPGPSEMPSILRTRSTLPVMHAEDKLLISPGRIYVAPADHHVVLADGVMELSRGPRENWTRPAIDPLFRTAARSFRDRVIGVVLSGALDDGTAGLIHIKHHGGLSIVQDPREAAVPDMPRNALREDDVDHIVKIADMPALLDELAREISNEKPRSVELPRVAK